MTVGAGVGVGDRLEVHHVLPEIGRLDARQELLRRVVHARIALMRRRGSTRGGRSERAEGYEAEQDQPRPRRSRARTKWRESLPLGADSKKWSRCPSASSAGARTSGGLMPNRNKVETRRTRAPPRRYRTSVTPDVGRRTPARRARRATAGHVRAA